MRSALVAELRDPGSRRSEAPAVRSGLVDREEVERRMGEVLGEEERGLPSHCLAAVEAHPVESEHQPGVRLDHLVVPAAQCRAVRVERVEHPVLLARRPARGPHVGGAIPELRALRWGDVDLASRVIHVRRGWDDVEGEQAVKSDAGERDVPILEPLRPALAAHRLRTSGAANGLVFGLSDERAFYPSTVRNRALAAWKAANEDREPDDRLEPIGLHEARHTCASVLIAAGCNAKVIQKVMGHATITMTFDQYGHLLPGGLEEAAARANAYLARSVAEVG